MKQIDKNALLDWEKYKEDIYRATPVDKNMSQADIEKHRLYLEAHPIEWIKFFLLSHLMRYSSALRVGSPQPYLTARRRMPMATVQERTALPSGRQPR